MYDILEDLDLKEEIGNVVGNHFIDTEDCDDVNTAINYNDEDIDNSV